MLCSEIRVNPEPLIVVDGLEIEIGGRAVRLILTPFQPYYRPGESPDLLMRQIMDMMLKLQNQGDLVFVYRKRDSTLGVVASQTWKEEIETRKIPVSQLVKIPIYQDDLS